ncbi:hypothetical protein [Fulvivirga lutea]|uniref:Ligand-binding SRPBCC domain-containing protein n=1 Tax=Fulvivirga lutea TaxID=2810512 RepID=A0A975A1V6_9BACT|nr:hypothetical protein [Fulvivirga lutea]QSE98829.1 hypothetical protein JR347_07050 [Fulvivirga lutea]
MQVIITSKVKGELDWVYSNFDAELFSYLLPPGAKLIAFGGSEKGAIVHLKLPVAGEWISEIIEEESTEGQRYFIDVGKKLPFPLASWHHKHLLTQVNSHVRIEDRMSFSTGFFLFDVMVAPFLWLAFIPRKWQYKSYFKNIRRKAS